MTADRFTELLYKAVSEGLGPVAPFFPLDWASAFPSQQEWRHIAHSLQDSMIADYAAEEGVPTGVMTDERFTELLNGPLQGPLPLMTLNRLALALRSVVESTGEAGAQALELYCKARQERDDTPEGEPPHVAYDR